MISEKEINPLEQAEINEQIERLSSIIDNNVVKLDDRQIAIIRERWLVPKQERKEHKEFTEKFGCSKQRVHQLEVEAFNKLKEKMELINV